MEKLYDAVIFDLDGVLCSTDRVHFDAWNAITKELNIDFDEKVNNKLRGVDRSECLDIILKNSGIKFSEFEKEEILEKKNTIFLSYINSITCEFVSEQVWEVLKELKKEGYKLAVGSSSKNAGIILNKTGLIYYFDTVVDGNSIVRGKPFPDIFMKAADDIGVRYDRCIVVEDSKVGIEAARRAGMESIGIGDASGSELTSFSIEDISEVLTILIDKKRGV